jgi:hypothetical protein
LVAAQGGTALPWVFVDLLSVGWLYEPDESHPAWGARAMVGPFGSECVERDDLPSRDEAIMWVLRRARPDVWRQERPVVWRVWAERVSTRPPRWQWWAGPLGDPDPLGIGRVFSGCDSAPGGRAWVRDRADARARDEYARQVTR